MELIKQINNDLVNYNGFNAIYFFDESEKDDYEELRNLLNKDYGYLDITLNKSDFDIILNGLENYNDFQKHIIVLDRLYQCILSKIDIKFDDEYIFMDDVINALKEKSLVTNNKKSRIHIMFDDVNDLVLQQSINDLIYMRRFNIMGYTSRGMLTRCTFRGELLESTHDYMSYTSDKRLGINEKKKQTRIRLIK